MTVIIECIAGWRDMDGTLTTGAEGQNRVSARFTILDAPTSGGDNLTAWWAAAEREIAAIPDLSAHILALPVIDAFQRTPEAAADPRALEVIVPIPRSLLADTSYHLTDAMLPQIKEAACMAVNSEPYGRRGVFADDEDV